MERPKGSTRLRDYKAITEPGLTVYARWAYGKYFILPLMVIVLTLWLIPWDKIYTLDWYQNVITFISHYSPNIELLPETKNQFPEYAIAFICFIHIVGIFISICSFYYGRDHYKKVENITSGYIPTIVLAKAFFGLLVFTPFCIFGVLNFTGSHYEPFLHSKLKFVSFMVAGWWLISGMFFSFSVIGLGLINRIRK